MSTSSAFFDIGNNRVTNTCGFAIETYGANHGTIHNNVISQKVRTQTITSTAGQTTYSCTWPSALPMINRVWTADQWRTVVHRSDRKIA